MMKRKNKFNAKIVKSNDGTFHSKAEYERWCELKLLEKSNKIKKLKRQVPYKLHAKGGNIIGKIVIDFDYWDDGKHVVEDKKGFMTPLARWKLKHLRLEYSNLQVRIT